MYLNIQIFFKRPIKYTENDQFSDSSLSFMINEKVGSH